MPDKKLLPLSLMPLELELTANPHAFYGVGTDYARDYVIEKIEIFAHVFFFEQTVHRAIEASVAEGGLFIHFNSFRLAPISTNSGAAES